MDLVLEASHRDTTERAASLRKNGWVPGCIYGKNVEPINFKVPKLSLKVSYTLCKVLRKCR